MHDTYVLRTSNIATNYLETCFRVRISSESGTSLRCAPPTLHRPVRRRHHAVCSYRTVVQ